METHRDRQTKQIQNGHPTENERLELEQAARRQITANSKKLEDTEQMLNRQYGHREGNNR
jgi:hypothetical protein